MTKILDFSYNRDVSGKVANLFLRGRAGKDNGFTVIVVGRNGETIPDAVVDFEMDVF